TLPDLGYPQQVEIFRRYGGPVVDAAALLRDPAGVLSRLCAALGIPYTEAMLHWPPGRRDTDGVWAPHWDASVERSNGFGPYVPPPRRSPPIPARPGRRRERVLRRTLAPRALTEGFARAAYSRFPYKPASLLTLDLWPRVCRAGRRSSRGLTVRAPLSHLFH